MRERVRGLSTELVQKLVPKQLLAVGVLAVLIRPSGRYLTNGDHSTPHFDL